MILITVHHLKHRLEVEQSLKKKVKRLLNQTFQAKSIWFRLLSINIILSKYLWAEALHHADIRSMIFQYSKIHDPPLCQISKWITGLRNGWKIFKHQEPCHIPVQSRKQPGQRPERDPREPSETSRQGNWRNLPPKTFRHLKRCRNGDWILLLKKNKLFQRLSNTNQ